MAKLLKIEKALFYFLALAFFWQWRLVWVSSDGFNEWTAFFLYATDLLIAAILILWLGRMMGKKRLILNSPKAELSSGRPPLKGGNDSQLKSDFGLPLKSDFSGLGRVFFYGDLSLLFFLFFCALSLFVASDKALGFYHFIKLLELVGFYFYVRYNFSALYSLKKFWQWFIAGAALQSAVAIVQFLTQHSLGWKFFAESPLAPNLAGVAKTVVAGEKIIRAYGLVPHPNILAAMLLVALFGLAWLFLFSHSDPAVAGEESRVYRSFVSLRMTKIKKFIFTIIFALLSVALFFTFSRGIIVVGGVLFLVWLAYLWRSSKEYYKSIISICILLFTVICLLLSVYWPYVSARYDLAALPASQSINLRSFYNQEAMKMIRQAPWLGVGPGNFVVALRQAVSALPDWQYQPAHNIYLLAAAENGLFALLAFLAFLFLTIKSAWVRRRDSFVSCWLFIVICLLIIGLFDHFLWDLQQGQILFWLILGLLASSSPRS